MDLTEGQSVCYNGLIAVECALTFRKAKHVTTVNHDFKLLATLRSTAELKLDLLRSPDGWFVFRWWMTKDGGTTVTIKSIAVSPEEMAVVEEACRKSQNI